MKWKCDNCGKEFELKLNPDLEEIDPPYFCPVCERLMDEAETSEDDFEDDYLDYGGGTDYL